MNEQLFEAYFREQLTPCEAEELKAVLRSEAGAKQFSEYAAERAQLKHAVNCIQTIEPLPRPRVRLIRPLLAAAALFAVAFLITWAVRKAPQTGAEIARAPERHFLHVDAASQARPAELLAADLPVAAWVGGDVTFERDVEVRKLKEAQAIQPGSEIRTGEGGWARLQYPDAAILDVEAKSRIRVEKSKNKTRRVHLRKGRLRFDLSQQARGQEMRLRTKRGTATMRKTRAAVQASPDSVKLTVDEGFLLLDIPEYEAMTVSAGQRIAIETDEIGKFKTERNQAKRVSLKKMEPEVIDDFERGRSWTVPRGSRDVTIRRSSEVARSGSHSLRVRIDDSPDRKLRETIVEREWMLDPEATGFRFWVYPKKLQDRVILELLLREADGDVWLCDKSLLSKFRRGRWIKRSARLPGAGNKHRCVEKNGDGVFDPSGIDETFFRFTTGRAETVVFLDDFSFLVPPMEE